MKAGPPAAVFIAWGLVGGRAKELAAELDADVLACYPPGDSDRPRPVRRYLLSTAQTVRYLLAHRPGTVVVTNPPVIPALLATLYAKAFTARVILDDHPGAFGAMGYRLGSRLEPLHRWAVRNAILCLVTEQTWVDKVHEWGGRAMILHESPGSLVPVPYRPPSHPARVLFVTVFARDEPVEEVIEAARLLPDVVIDITGDPARRPPGGPLPDNVRLVGLLPEEQYREALRGADVVVALTTEPTSAMRAAFEAVWVEKVQVISDWPLLETLFPEAVHVANDSRSIADGIGRALKEHATRAELSGAARRRQLDQWEDQVRHLQAALAEGTSP